MSENDQLIDSLALRELRESLDDVAIPQAPALETITRRGQAHRQQRRLKVTGLTGAGAIAAAVAAVGLSGAFSSSSRLHTLHTPSFTLASYTDGTAKLTLNPGELLNPAALQSAFAQDGIPAKVTTGSYCTSDPQPAGFSQAVSGPAPGTSTDGTAQQLTITIDASKIPAGTELTVGDFNLPTGEQQANFSLMSSSSYTCTTTPPDMSTPDTSDEDLGVLYGGPGFSGS